MEAAIDSSKEVGTTSKGSTFLSASGLGMGALFRIVLVYLVDKPLTTANLPSVTDTPDIRLTASATLLSPDFDISSLLIASSTTVDFFLS